MANSHDSILRHLIRELRFLRVEDSLLFLARALSASRSEVTDPVAQAYLARLRRPLPDFVIHLLVKLVLRYGRRVTPEALDWARFLRVFPLALEFAIADPLCDSSDESVGGYFVRMMSQQMQRQIDLQSYGLAVGLFQDLDATRMPGTFDVREEVERALKMPVELFMRLGHGAIGAAQAAVNGVKQPGTLNIGWLKAAEEQIPAVPWLEKWLEFARAVSCTQDEFNVLARQHSVGLSDDAFLSYEFNPLQAKPLIQTEEDHYICVDPHLVVHRTSWGIFQDAYNRSRKGFSSPFGEAFERFVGQLLASVVPEEALWGERKSERVRQLRAGRVAHHKLADWIYRSNERNVFIECKSARPSLALITYARPSECRRFAVEVAKALQQLVEHAAAVERGEWAIEGLTPRPATMVVVTFGRVETVNGPFFRNWIDEELASFHLSAPRYVVLSLEELDSVIWLAESGAEFGVTIDALTSEASFDPLQRYVEALRQRAVSSFALRKSERMWDFLPPDKE